MARPKRKTALYTAATTAGDASSGPEQQLARVKPSGTANPSGPTPDAEGGDKRSSRTRERKHWSLTTRWLLLSALMLAAALYALAPWKTWLPHRLTQEDIDAAVLSTLNEKTLPSPAAKAHAAVIGSVVRVIGVMDPRDKPIRDPKDVVPPKKRNGSDAQPKPGTNPDEDDDKNTVGTGVVIIDNGTILTNLHVVAGAKRVKVEFSDGLISDADLLSLKPEHDLAVLRARRIPDDLKAAVMRSTSDLKPGDRVTAVGFPFGIGPSVSHGVISGMKRNFRSPDGDTVLTNLIQFDAAANPGNSGGPLVTDDGAVVGIVTAIYNPTSQRFFVGLGFAVPIESAAQAAGMPPF